MVDFSQVEATLQQTKQEVTEHEAAVATLEEAKTALAGLQTQVAEAQTAVAQASDTANAEKADVINGINAAITQLQGILASMS